MRKVKLQMQVTIDGFVAGPNGEMDWITWDWDEDLKKYVMGITEPVDCILLGRVLAQGFIPHWKSVASGPESDESSFAHKMVDTPKVIFSKTLETAEWENTHVAKNPEEEITRLKSLPGKDIMVYGGSSFVSSLIQLGLIDEYHLFVNPVAIGAGMPIFNKLNNKFPLKLVKTTPTSCGIVVQQYVPGNSL